MVMSSHQIAALASQQQAMFGNFQSYAAQITPAYGAGPGMGALRPPVMGGYHTGAPPMMPPPPPPMPGLGMGYGGGMMQMAAMMPYASPQMGMQQAMGEQLTGSLLGGASTLGSGLARIGGYGTMGAAGLSMLGMGGMGMAALGGLPGMALVGGLEAGAYGLNQMYAGFQERQNVNRVLRQRFGGMMGIGGGRGGMGFNTQEMGQISSMVRGMADQDMYTSFDELTRLMDRTAQMGLYRGVQGARQFQTRFKETVASLTEIAKTMHTSLEGAAQFFEQARGQGFFSGRDITATLMQTRMAAGASGMSMQQMMAVRDQGTQMGRMMGMRGRTGAGAMMQMATNIGTGMRIGAISDELVAEATGGLTGAEGAQAAAGQLMQINQRWLQSGAGRVMLAGMWDPETGRINRERMAQVMAGTLSFQQLREMGRANIAQTGGRRSAFFRDEERLRGAAMEEGGAPLMLGMIQQHFGSRRELDLEDPIMQRWLRRRMGMSQSQVELFVREVREMPRIMAERQISNRNQIEMEGRTRSMEGRGFEGLRRRMSHWWDTSVVNPIRQEGDNLVTSLTKQVDQFFADMEGSVKTNIDQRVKDAVAEFGRTGEITKGGFLMGGKEFQQYGEKLRRSWTYTSGVGTQAREDTVAGGLGRWLGLQGATVTARAGKGQLDLATYGSRYGLKRASEYSSDAAWERARENAVAKATGSLTTDVVRSLGVSDTDLIRLQDQTAVLMSERFRGTEDQAAFQRWRDLRQSNPMAASTEAINYLARSNPAIADLFKKTGDDPYLRANLLNRLSSGVRDSVYSAGVERLPTSLTSENLAREIDAIAERKERALTRIESLGRERGGRKLGWFARGVAGMAASSVGGGGPGAVAPLGGGAAPLEYAAGDTGINIRSILENQNLSDTLRTAVMSNDPADRARAMATLRVAGAPDPESGRAPIPGIGSKDIANLVADLEKKDSTVRKELTTVFQDEAYRSSLVVIERGQQQGRELQEYSKKYRSDIENALKDEPGMLKAFDQMVRSRAEGTMVDARRDENEFYAKYGNSAAAKNLLGILQREEGGAGAFVAYGLGLTQSYYQGLGKKESTKRDKEVLDRFLRGMGIEGGLSAVYGGGQKGNRAVKELLKKAEEGTASIEEVLTQVRAQKIEVAGGLRMDVFQSQGAEIISAMRGKIQDTELGALAAGRASGFAEGARVEGTPPERQRSPVELAQKQVDLLTQMVKLTYQANKDRIGMSADERAALEKALKINVNVTTSASGGASSAGQGTSEQIPGDYAG